MWKEYQFILDNDFLRSRDNENIFLLLDIEKIERARGLWPGFEITSKSQPIAHLRAESLTDADEWISKLEKARSAAMNE